MQKKIRIIIGLVLFAVLGAGALFKYQVTYIRYGHIVEAGTDRIVLRGVGQNPLMYILKVEPDTVFYDSNGQGISIADLSKGQHVKIKLLPQSYGSTFHIRQANSIRWLKLTDPE